LFVFVELFRRLAVLAVGQWFLRRAMKMLLSSRRMKASDDQRFSHHQVDIRGRYHAAHRFRYTLYDGLQLQHLQELILLVSYGGAIVGSVAAGVLLWQF
jgi:hypothetical protein